MTLSPFSTGCSLSSHLGPSLLSSLLLPSILPRLRHPPHVYHSHHVPEQRSSQDSMFGHASGRSITAWLSWTLALSHATQPWRRVRPLWLVTWALGFVLALSFAWSFGLVPAHTESDCGLLGTDNISIKSLYILQQRRSRSLLAWSSYLLPARAFDDPHLY